MKKRTILISGFGFLLVAIAFSFFYLRAVTIVHVADLAKTPLNTGEIQRLKAIHLDCFEDVYRKNVRSYYQEKYRLTTPAQIQALDAEMDRVMVSYRESIDNKFKRLKNLYLVKRFNKIIGEFSCQIDHSFTDGSPILYDVCLEKEMRGQGYGAKMIDYAIQNCSTIARPLVLTVYKDQDKLIKMYEGYGFKTVPFEKTPDDSLTFYNKIMMKLYGKKNSMPK